MRLFLLTILASLVSPAFAQDREGNNTAGEWITTHYVDTDLWTSACDERETDGALEERCYVRYVDVYSLAPRFGAIVTFVTWQDGAPRIEFGFEKGVTYEDDGFAIERDDTVFWQLSDGCLRSVNCVFEGDSAVALLERLMTPDGQTALLRQKFTDKFGQTFDLEWDLTRFASVVADFERESAKRGLH